MNRKLIIKLFIDLGLTASMLAAFAYHLTGPAAHEWTGLTMFALLTAHNGLNWHWYRNIGRTGAGIHGRLSSIVNMALLVAAAVLLISSLIVSRELFNVIRVGNGFLMRQIHTLVAYWILVLVSVHIGLQWTMIMAVTRQMMGAGGPSRLSAVLVRLTGAAVMAGGLWASFDRGLGDKLSMRHSFDYWEGSAAGFFFTYLLIMGFYIGLTHYSLMMFKRHQAANRRNQPWGAGEKKPTWDQMKSLVDVLRVKVGPKTGDNASEALDVIMKNRTAK